MTAKLKQNLKQLQQYAGQLEKAKRSHVAVGLPQEKVGGQIYGGGTSIMQVGAWHEFGEGRNPQRSFLRVPFQLKADEINDYTASLFAKVFSGEPVDKLLGLLGIKAQNISRGAFASDGYGTWPAITAATAKAKGSSRTLIDTGTLRASISYVVRGA